MKTEFKDRLRQAMNDRNMIAADLRRKTGVPKSAMSYYLSGRSEPKAPRLYLIAQALDVSEAWLLGYDVPMERTPERKKDDAIGSIVKELSVNNEFFDVVNALRTDPEFMTAVLSIRNFAAKSNDS